MKRLSKTLMVIGTCLGLVSGAQAQEAEFSGGIPNIAAIGVGRTSDYFGSDNALIGAAPLLRYNFGDNRFINVIGNVATVNVLDDPNWRFGPVAIYRFGRGHVKDDVVNATRNIKGTVELGASLAYDYKIPGSDGRDRWTLYSHFAHDVGGEHGGYVIAGSVTRLFGVGRYGIMGLNAGTTWGSGDYTETYFGVDQRDSVASGLPSYNADAGFRDVRVIGFFAHPLSRHWIAGVGGMYQRVVGDAADSPLVKDRGSKDQFMFGAGIGRVW